MARQKQGRDLKNWHPATRPPGPGKVRIIGGHFRGRLLEYSGDSRTRPMKDNIREALFNLVGGWIPGKLAIDLFAGTGAIGLEALSRGASQVILVERHLPSIRILQRNLQSLGANLPVEIHTADSYFWIRQFFKQSLFPPQTAWAVFFSPPYSHFDEHRDQVVSSLQAFIHAAPAGSLIVVESDSRFDLALLPFPEQWNVRHYAPATLSVWRHPQA